MLLSFHKFFYWFITSQSVHLSLNYPLAPTNWSELSGTERTRDVVHAGWRDDLGITAFSSSSPFTPFFLSSCFHCSTSREERDRGRGRGGGGEDGLTVDCGHIRNRSWHVFTCGQQCSPSVDICKNYISICFVNTCFDSSPVAERSIVFGLRLLEVHAIDGAAVHSGRTLPGRLGSRGMVRDIGAYGHCRRGICSICLWGEWRRLGRGGRT